MPDRPARRLRLRLPLRASALVAAGLALGAAGVATGVPTTGDYVRGVEVVKKVSAKNSNSQKDMYVECPEGKKAIGGGADVDSAFTGGGTQAVSVVALRTSQPSNGLLPVPEANSGPPTKGWHATAMETTASTLKWTLTVHVICADVAGSGPQQQQRLLSDLAMEKEYESRSDSRPGRGDLVYWRLTVSNFGPDDTTAVQVVDTPGEHLTFDAAESDARCTAVGDTVECSVAALASGAEEDFVVAFEIGDVPWFQPVENCARVSSANADAAGSNNEDCADYYVDTE